MAHWLNKPIYILKYYTTVKKYLSIAQNKIKEETQMNLFSENTIQISDVYLQLPGKRQASMLTGHDKSLREQFFCVWRNNSFCTKTKYIQVLLNLGVEGRN